MSETNVQEKFKEKITAVRTVVPNRSNNEIVLVLQHFDNNVDKAVQAFMDGSAVEVLKEWNMPGKKKHNKKRKRKLRQANGQVKDEKTQGLGENADLPLPKGGLNGYHANSSANDDSSADSLSEKTEILSNDEKAATSPVLHQLMAPEKTVGLSQENETTPLELLPQPVQDAQKCQTTRTTNKMKPKALPSSHPPAPMSSSVPGDPASSKKRAGTSIEKSVKDLQRCTVSLARYQLLIKEEMDASVKKIKTTFAELQACIMDREVALMTEMDKVKKEAMEILEGRQRRAEELKRLTDMAIQMSESQLAELRAEIKQFVSERKYDEDLGKSARFTGNVSSLQTQIQLFGEVSHPKNNYSTRSQCSSFLVPRHQNPRGDSSNVHSPSSSLSATASTGHKVTNSKDSSNVQKVPTDRQNNQRNGPSNQRRSFYPRAQGQRLSGSSFPGKPEDGRDRGRKGPPQEGYKSQHQNSKSGHQGQTHDTGKLLTTNSNSPVPPTKINSQSRPPEPDTPVSAVFSKSVSQYRSCPIKQEIPVDTKVLSIPNRMTVVA
ncbi:SPATS2-like protein [Hypanus sabinus]|uniref:SPATS2-like protein n=1 Tax=Hypanus sabinus TaxID=79690 RepID=UPI0028C507ED|nr:SPATS2-like protein [Hypanus sabinus]XP_059822975.1 SPATS2-like protein [Hypanus sabinus]XP_059822976.1 SPATS2-like protein [Hypanus sabinus]XP_059822977.1 SPATS2-like protein [Hypanus sabinus]XP_059822978.1 SPATS2-like protein [Hypanus sabinus]